MASQNQHSNHIGFYQQIQYIIGIFILVGLGISLTGVIVIAQIGTGNAIMAGILTTVIVSVTFILAPVIGLLSGLRTGQNHGRQSNPYLSSFIGSIVGYIGMMVVVFVVLAIGITAVSGGAGGTGTMQSGQSTSVSASSSQFAVSDYFLPLITIMIPTVITTLGGTYLGGVSGDSDGGVSIDGLMSQVDIPSKNIVIVAAILVIVAIGVTVGPSLLPPNLLLQVSGDVSTPGNSVFAEGTISNPSGSEFTDTLTVELIIDGQTVATAEESISIPANSETDIRLLLVSGPELSEQQTKAITNGDFKIRYIINGKTHETYQP